jgi:cell wall-associated NlpC family hydrolase
MGAKALILTGFGRFRRRLLVGLLVLAMAGCASAQPHVPAPKRADSTAGKDRTHPGLKIPAPAPAADDLAQVERRLRSEVRHWEGTPHRLGGSSRRGIDCSGFVQRLYRDVFGRRIPRSTALLVKSGAPVASRQLRTGDLVFFKVPDKGRHVGIYLGRAEFAHASTSKGVTISSLEDQFWHRSYWTARRFLDTPN